MINPLNIHSSNCSPHSFHIPVMGLGFTIDTPLKVARYGIDSVVSIMEDHLVESMRKIHSRKNAVPYIPIKETDHDARAKRITAYLDLLKGLVDKQVEALKESSFEEKDSEINRYFALLPEDHPKHKLYRVMLQATCSMRSELQEKLRNMVVPGKIHVNIMTKVDKRNYDEDGQELPREFSDGLAALRGFANSKLRSSVVFSAGMNPSLYGYLEEFENFYPADDGLPAKGVILKVSDFRSAHVQGKFLAKKGIWVEEFRLESGLNCGGHAFATDGMLMGPILAEFRQNRTELNAELMAICQQALQEKGKPALAAHLRFRLTAQGGVGTHEEHQLLRASYGVDSVGWGSPFLLVPEATAVDQETLNRLITAKASDFFLSHASPLGVPFNNLRTSSGEVQRKARIEKGRPGSPCYKKVLSFNTEFTEKPICTSSRQYQHLKLKALESQKGEKGYQEAKAQLLEKDCLCEGLSAPAILAEGEKPARNLSAVTICPGPNLAYFKGIYSLKEMVDHIYGKATIQLTPQRPQVFIKELQLTMDHFKSEWKKLQEHFEQKKVVALKKSKTNLERGIGYYQHWLNQIIQVTEVERSSMQHALEEAKRYFASVSLTS
ncbi:hypothetical protein [Echinicola vietnamensis]|uniref:Uncharacterized protein n=1 Tax=Echinicola vietnamensis (strain DSM 17526 / LMG 23754 / KMM 6221) TaxID=926556 RepID=L0G3U7_ECHVK|nr:hypothetical protein [Echinicola vietnamensis]AGA79671.1 hypothetical protein Echvi_3455 [Echinicola vietnamensis DSM 17526]